MSVGRHLTPEELAEVLRKLDEALAEGQRLRELLTTAMAHRGRGDRRFGRDPTPPKGQPERRKKPG